MKEIVQTKRWKKWDREKRQKMCLCHTFVVHICHRIWWRKYKEIRKWIFREYMCAFTVLGADPAPTLLDILPVSCDYPDIPPQRPCARLFVSIFVEARFSFQTDSRWGSYWIYLSIFTSFTRNGRTCDYGRKKTEKKLSKNGKGEWMNGPHNRQTFTVWIKTEAHWQIPGL